MFAILRRSVKGLTERGHSGNIYVLTGPQALTYFDVARLLSDAIGKPVIYEALTENEAVTELIENVARACRTHSG